MSDEPAFKPPRTLQFPPHTGPRVWFITPAASPISIALIRELLEHGDYVAATLLPADYDGVEQHVGEFKDFLDEVRRNDDWRARLKIIGMDIRLIGECQSAIADAISCFGHIDIVFCCSSEAVIGSIEELSSSPRAQSLVRTQFGTNFFGPVALIKSALPHFRARQDGHFLILTGITGHLGTPGLSIYCAAQWAIEGYCDSLAYEMAPFNIKMSIVQSTLEISVLSNKLTAVPPMPAYMPPENTAPLSRGLLAGLLDKLWAATPTTADADAASQQPPGNLLLAPTAPTSLHPTLPPVFRARLVAETVHALLAIGGHPNPPARHIVGYEAVAAVKEKLKTVTEELEDFVEVSAGVDY